jgi:pseudouridylate synthase
MKFPIEYSDEVANAMRSGQAVVALESTIISHGMPYPKNLEVAQRVESTVRINGAVPATIAIIKGEIHVGLSSSELEFFAQSTSVMKCSRRDLPMAISAQLNGATTVAATMILSEMAGIKFFATGGIGGVHRGFQVTQDVSADLQEFHLSEVVVVSAGAKAILDLAATLEVLETYGVPVIGYGTDNFPAFYSRASGLKTPLRCDSPVEVASFIKAKWDMGLCGGALVANPIPFENEIPENLIEPQVQEALVLAEKAGISGKELTPFLLKKLNELTDGKSQMANEALVINNAELAARIAVAYTNLLA